MSEDNGHDNMTARAYAREEGVTRQDVKALRVVYGRYGRTACL